MPHSANSNSGSTGTTSAAAAAHRSDEASTAGSTDEASTAGSTDEASTAGSTDEASTAGSTDEASTAGSEAEYLAEQAAFARAAMLGVIGDLQANARTRWEQATDLRGWIDRHPWVAVGAASAAGFAAAAVVTPAPGQSLGEKLSSTIEAAMSRAEEANGEAVADEAPAPRAGRQASQASIWGMLLEPVIEVLKVAAQNYFTAYVAGRAAAQATCTPDSDESDGDESGSAPSASASSAESTETNASAMA